jgi:hypothetical protein
MFKINDLNFMAMSCSKDKRIESKECKDYFLHLMNDDPDTPIKNFNDFLKAMTIIRFILIDDEDYRLSSCFCFDSGKKLYM